MITRSTYFFAFLLCCALLGAAFFLQFYRHLTPCPLCLIQRFIIALLAFFFLIKSLFIFQNWFLNVSTQLVCVLLSLTGAFVSGRHVWLQQVGTAAGGCSGDVTYLLNHFPLRKVLFLMLNNAGNCAVVDWRFLTLSLSSWSLLFFLFFTVLCSYQLYLYLFKKDF